MDAHEQYLREQFMPTRREAQAEALQALIDKLSDSVVCDDCGETLRFCVCPPGEDEEE